MNVEWIRGKEPTEEKQYVVKVDMRTFHFSYPAVRKWKEGKWQAMSPHESVTAWLDGLEL